MLGLPSVHSMLSLVFDVLQLHALGNLFLVPDITSLAWVHLLMLDLFQAR